MVLVRRGGVNELTQEEKEQGKTLLHRAAISGISSRVKEELKVEGIDVNAKDNKGKTPLHYAVELPLPSATDLSRASSSKERDLYYLRGQNHLIQQFLNNYKAKVNRHEKVVSVYSKIVKNLLNVEGIKVNEADNEGKTPLHYAASLGEPFLNILLEEPKIDVNAKDLEGKTPLHDAVECEKPEKTMNILLGEPKIDLNAKDLEGKTPLHDAVERVKPAAVNILLGAPKIDVNAKDNDEKTPLEIFQGKIFSKSMKSSEERIGNLLQERIRIQNLPQEEKDQEFVDAVKKKEDYSKQMRKIRYLLNFGANVNAIIDGQTAYSFAFSKKLDKDIITLLTSRGGYSTEKYKEHVEQKSQEFVAAVKEKNVDVEKIRNLLKAGANVNAIIDGQTAYSFAFSKGLGQEIIDLLKSRGGTPSKQLEVKNEVTNLLNERARIQKLSQAEKDQEFVAAVKEKNVDVEKIRNLLRAGANVNAIIEGQTAYSFAVSKGLDKKIIDLLKSRGGYSTEKYKEHVEQKSQEFVAAVKKPDVEKIGNLLKAGANVNAIIDGQTAVSFAASNKLNKDIIDLLTLRGGISTEKYLEILLAKNDGKEYLKIFSSKHDLTLECFKILLSEEYSAFLQQAGELFIAQVYQNTTGLKDSFTNCVKNTKENPCAKARLMRGLETLINDHIPSGDKDSVSLWYKMTVKTSAAYAKIKFEQCAKTQLTDNCQTKEKYQDKQILN